MWCSWLWLFRSCCVSHVKSDLTLVEMVYVHETLTLIILAGYVAGHLKRKSCLVEVVTAGLNVGRERVEVAGTAGELLTGVELFPRANWLLMFLALLMVWESCRCSLSSPSS